MTDYKAGTVAVATVRGVPNVRVMSTGGGDWVSTVEINEDFWHYEGKHPQVTDIRPLAVLDLDGAPDNIATWGQVSNYLRGNLSKTAHWLAGQIEAQTEPPRIPEPGLWGLVTAHTERKPDRRTFGRIPDPNDAMQWTDEGDNWWHWDDLIDPVLIRKGVEG